MRVLMPLPKQDFDPTEAAVSWKILTEAGHEVVFATPDGGVAAGDEMMISGRGLDPWGFIPGLRNLTLLGNIVRANADGRSAYAAMAASPAYAKPLTYAAVEPAAFDGLLLPGGHRARGMRAYLESAPLQAIVAAFFDAGKPVGAICHGVLLAARSTSPRTGKSCLYGKRTTSLTWDLEKAGWTAGRITRFWDPGYYRTYVEKPGEPTGYASVQQEVSRLLARPDDFVDVPKDGPDYKLKTDGMHRDSTSDARPAFVVTDGNYVSARWPGDAHTFAKTFVDVLSKVPQPA